MLLVLVGLIRRLIVSATPHPRLALGDHNQFVTNGMLFIVLATALLALPHAVGIKSVWAMGAAAWLTYSMAISELINSWWGTTQMLSLAAGQAGAIGGEPWQELVL
jgi:hydroxylaminobenzene mutase